MTKRERERESEIILVVLLGTENSARRRVDWLHELASRPAFVTSTSILRRKIFPETRLSGLLARTTSTRHGTISMARAGNAARSESRLRRLHVATYYIRITALHHQRGRYNVLPGRAPWHYA
jgi:hypothetical protein